MNICISPSLKYSLVTHRQYFIMRPTTRYQIQNLLRTVCPRTINLKQMVICTVARDKHGLGRKIMTC
jgi:hypothetical protein